ncbi:sodium:solute symporter family protein [Acanthopleuribacter pedis]|uniref:Sodium:solute symporter family protein n=1 Tax=Acanthopleuribacter pedis TaxID=442870 RepID=A0A8J7Q1Q1_9BACT|nr:sodium:solute symporter family protein [Acanthopleuribacter pedis]MBO1317304.1 sodium:solute symporter family protein [Acanthopleuribacter pedis]MBO1318611.1 sodium:solute symporter family protein [Acanthopleuribacter pedis]
MLPETSIPWFAYLVTAFYVGLTYFLSVKGMRRTKSLAGFSIGNGDMSPVLVGLTMASSIASTATFVINPGFVYTHGLSAFLHYGVAASGGIIAALLLLCHGFRRTGARYKALTIPHWIREHYGSRGLALFFALINLLSITFVVLILVGCAILTAQLFDISRQAALIAVLLFVFSYVLMGGTYAHAYTNSFQAVLMLFIAVALFVSGLGYFNGDFFGSLAAVSPQFAAPLNAESTLYYDFWSVFASGFIVTFALMMQPHILTKVLYLKNDRDVKWFLVTAIGAGLIFSLMLFTGFYARLSGLEVGSQDAVVAHYIAAEMEGIVGGTFFLTIITIALLAAGMSTLDGILVSLSAMVVNDLYFPFSKAADKERLGLHLSRLVLVVIGLVAFALAWQPPALVGLFAQKGVYGLAAASVVPIVFGVLMRRPVSAWIAASAAVCGLTVHLALHLGFGVANPSVSASYAILASFCLGFVCLGLDRPAEVGATVTAAEPQ